MNNQFSSCRPALAARAFVSEAVEGRIQEITRRIGYPELAWLFANCFPNTLDTTVKFTPGSPPDSFVITGDIDAMWLRDSCAQVWPYLELAKTDAKLQALFEGLIRRHVDNVLLDPYANAFNDGPTGSEWESDHTQMRPEIHERKWEIDSLCYTVRLCFGFWKQTGLTSAFNDAWLAAMRLIVQTFTEQQRKNVDGPYSFMRTSPIATDTVPLRGYGNPTRKVGLIHSMFRPSDDACILPFLIPANLFAITSLRQLAEMVEAVHADSGLAATARALAQEVEAAVRAHAIIEHPTHGRIYAYEVDGFGGHILMDDANTPSLLSLPYLGCVDAADEIYQNTRRFVLSEDNPYFRRSSDFEGVSGPHIGPLYIWPMSITMRALTSNDDDEIRFCLRQLVACHAGTGFMHESFRFDDPSDFTRSWFAWANTLFGELISRLSDQRPHLLSTTT